MDLSDTSTVETESKTRPAHSGLPESGVRQEIEDDALEVMVLAVTPFQLKTSGQILTVFARAVA
jgi:hypothetical protein